MKAVRNLARRAPVAAIAAPASLVVASPAFAQATGPDFSTLTGAISLDSTEGAILAVGALLVGLALAIKGAKVILRMIG